MGHDYDTLNEIELHHGIQIFQKCNDKGTKNLKNVLSLQETRMKLEVHTFKRQCGIVNVL